MSEYPRYAFYGHHKCATMWLNGISAGVANRLGLKFRPVYNPQQFNGDLAAYAIGNRIDFIAYGNAHIEHVSALPPHKGFHIIRDPRDIAVSAYYSHLHSHSTTRWKALEDHRKTLRSLNKDDGLALEIEFRRQEFEDLATWDYSQSHVMEIRFEDMVSRGYDLMLEVFSFLGLLDDRDYSRRLRLYSLLADLSARLFVKSRGKIPQLARFRRLPPPELLTLAWRQRFEKKARGRSKGSEDVQSHYRKGAPGDWRNHFSEEHKALFRRLYPGLVNDLGYEASDDW